MIINKKKSAIMPLYRRRKKLEETEEYDGYPIVEKYKFLGIWIDNGLSLTNHLEHITKKLQGFYKMVYILNQKQAPLNIRLTLWKVFARAYFYYAGFVFYQKLGFCTKGCENKFHKLYKKSLIKAMGLKVHLNTDVYQAIHVLEPQRMASLNFLGILSRRNK